MRTKVFYDGDKNLTNIALYISTQLRQQSEQLPPAYLPENMPIVFVGSGARLGGKPTKEVVEFLKALDPKRTQRAALFTNKGQKTIDAMKALCEANGVKVMDTTLVCTGKLDSNNEKMCDDFVNAIADVIEHRN